MQMIMKNITAKLIGEGAVALVGVKHGRQDIFLAASFFDRKAVSLRIKGFSIFIAASILEVCAVDVKYKLIKYPSVWL